MRWYVEVSRVGENGVADEYCVEAKQWQAALQEARKLRGDSGALSKFSIELLDRGYRAVDPALKLRYLINEAPPDAKLSEDAGKPPKVQAAPAPVKAATAEPPASLAPPAVAPAASAIPRPSTQAAPRPQSVHPPRVASVAPRAQQLLVPDDAVPPAPRVPSGLTPELEFSRPRVPAFELVRQRAEEPRPESPITYREFAYAVAPGATRAELEALLQDRYQATRAAIEQHPPGKFVQLAVFDHVFKRKPERPPLATFVWKDWRGAPIMAFPGFGEAPMGPVSQVPPARDSVPPNGSRVSSMPPPATAQVAPRPASVAAPRPSASAELAPSIPPESKPLVPMRVVVLESKPAPAKAPVSAPPETRPPFPERASQIPPAPTPIAAAAPEAPRAEPVPEPLDIPVTEEPIALVRRIEEPLTTAPSESAPSESAPEEQPIALVRRVDESPQPAKATPEFELTFESAPLRASVAPVRVEQKSNPETARASRPRLGISRRRAGEDLIGELFELMHELHFMRDVAQGAEYVLAVIDEVLPCEGALIHVFDIDTGHFVVVRAKGPNAASVLLQRMSDQEPIVLSVMRSTRALSVEVASSDARFAGPRWQALGVAPERALCGAVQQAGRYLGLIELANPQGGTPFHPTELNALDYICQQFADFLSQKPIVLTADVVLARA